MQKYRDRTKPAEAIDRAKPGDVIVMDVWDASVAVRSELASDTAMNMSVKKADR